VEHDTLKKPIIGQQVLTELRNNCSIISKRFIKRYIIKKALPDLENFDYGGSKSGLNFPTLFT
jgi:hypothetical protein